MGLLFALGLGVPVAPSSGLRFPDLGFAPKQFSPCTPPSPLLLDLLAPYTWAPVASMTAPAECQTQDSHYLI